MVRIAEPNECYAVSCQSSLLQAWLAWA